MRVGVCVGVCICMLGFKSVWRCEWLSKKNSTVTNFDVCHVWKSPQKYCLIQVLSSSTSTKFYRYFYVLQKLISSRRYNYLHKSFLLQLATFCKKLTHFWWLSNWFTTTLTRITFSSFYINTRLGFNSWQYQSLMFIFIFCIQQV